MSFTIARYPDDQRAASIIWSDGTEEHFRLTEGAEDTLRQVLQAWTDEELRRGGALEHDDRVVLLMGLAGAADPPDEPGLPWRALLREERERRGL